MDPNPPMGFAKGPGVPIGVPVQPVFVEVPIELEPVFGYRSLVRKKSESKPRVLGFFEGLNSKLYDFAFYDVYAGGVLFSQFWFISYTL